MIVKRDNFDLIYVIYKEHYDTRKYIDIQYSSSSGGCGLSPSISSGGANPSCESKIVINDMFIQLLLHLSCVMFPMNSVELSC